MKTFSLFLPIIATAIMAAGCNALPTSSRQSKSQTAKTADKMSAARSVAAPVAPPVAQQFPIWVSGFSKLTIIEVQGSTNLSQWYPILTMQVHPGSNAVLILPDRNVRQQFYRFVEK